MKKVEILVNGIKVAYWTNGLQDKEKILFLHGFRGNHKGLLKTAEMLQNFNIILPDLPGYGESETLNSEHTFETYSSFLSDFCGAINFKNGIIVGHSFGASLALVFAARHPEPIKSLYLIAPVLSAGTIEAWFGKVFYEIAAALPDSLRKLWLFNRFFDAVSNLALFRTSSFSKKMELIYDGQKNLKKLDEKVVMENFLSYYQTDFKDLISKINAPTFIIAGTSDSLCAETTLEELENEIKNSKVERIPNEGHIIPLEQPKLLGETLSRLLAFEIKNPHAFA